MYEKLEKRQPENTLQILWIWMHRTRYTAIRSVCTTECRALLHCALALSFCTTTNSVVLSQLRSAQDSNTCVLRFNEKYLVNFRKLPNFSFWQCFWNLESDLKRVTVLKLQTTDNLCEVWKVYIFIMDQGKKFFIWVFDFVLEY